MAFDKTLPADATKLRLGPGVIRDNWDAIVTGAASFTPAVINLTKQGATPALLANNYRLFSKVGPVNVELFGINSAGNAVQLTKGLPTVATTGITFLPGGLFLAWGQSATGGVITVTGMTTIYQVVATVNDTSGTPTDRNIAINSMATNTFKVYSSSAGQVNWIAIGV